MTAGLPPVLAFLILTLLSSSLEGKQDKSDALERETVVSSTSHATNDVAQFLTAISHDWRARLEGRKRLDRLASTSDDLAKRIKIGRESSGGTKHPDGRRRGGKITAAAVGAADLLFVATSFAERFKVDFGRDDTVPAGDRSDFLFTTGRIADKWYILDRREGERALATKESSERRCENATTDGGHGYCIELICPPDLESPTDCMCKMEVEGVPCDICDVCPSEVGGMTSSARPFAADCRVAAGSDNACFTCSGEPCPLEDGSNNRGEEGKEGPPAIGTEDGGADGVVAETNEKHMEGNVGTPEGKDPSARQCDILNNGSNACLELSCPSGEECTCEFSIENFPCHECTVCRNGFAFNCTNLDAGCLRCDGKPCGATTQSETSLECQKDDNGEKTCLEVSCSGESLDDCTCGYSVGGIECDSCTVCGVDGGRVAPDCRNLGDPTACITCDGQNCSPFNGDGEEGPTTECQTLDNGLDVCIEVGCPANAEEVLDCTCMFYADDMPCSSCTVCGGEMERDFAADCQNLEGVDACLTCMEDECKAVPLQETSTAQVQWAIETSTAQVQWAISIPTIISISAFVIIWIF